MASPGKAGADADGEDDEDGDDADEHEDEDRQPLLEADAEDDDEEAAAPRSFLRAVAHLVGGNADYRLLWVSDIVNGFGDWFNYLAVVTLVTDLSGSSSLAVAALLLTRSLPQTVLTPLVGWAADRFDRVVVMMVSNLTLAVVVLVYLAAGQSLALLFTVSVLQASLGAFYDPAQAGVTPSVVARSELMVANALDTTTWSTMLALGSFAGGIALHYLGTQACFLVDSASYVISTAFLARLWFRLRARRRRQEPVHPSPDREAAPEDKGAASTPPAPAAQGAARANLLLDGLRFLRRNPAVFYMCFVKATDSVSWGAMDVINIAAVERVFSSDGNYALLLGLYYLAVAVGTAVGPLLARAVPTRYVDPDRLPGMVVWVQLSACIVVLGVGLQAMFPTLLPLFFVGNIVRCAGNAINYVVASSFLQTVLPEAYRGRTFALEAGINMAAMTSAQLLAGALMDTWALAPGDAARIVAVATFCFLVFWLTHFAVARKAYGVLYTREARNAPALAE